LSFENIPDDTMPGKIQNATVPVFGWSESTQKSTSYDVLNDSSAWLVGEL